MILRRRDWWTQREPEAGAARGGAEPPVYRTMRFSGPNLLGIDADLEGLGIGAGELIDRRLELPALAVLVAVDRAADAIELGREHGVTKRFLADVGRALVVGLRDLFNRLEGKRRAVIGMSVVAFDRRLPELLFVLLDQGWIALAHRLRRQVRIGNGEA